MDYDLHLKSLTAEDRSNLRKLKDAKIFDELVGTIKISQDVENLDTKRILAQVKRLQSGKINRKTKNYVFVEGFYEIF